MPLTPAHAAVAPVLHRMMRFCGVTTPLSAVVIGTMTPDFSYLIRLSPGGGAWHTPLGLVEFCLPAGMAIWLIFRLLIGPALIQLLPPGLGVAARELVAPGPTRTLVPAAGAAVLVGAVSHDLWDSFTHEARWGVRQIPGLESRIPFHTDHVIRWYAILQYTSSLVGMLIVVAILWRWVLQFPPEARHVPVGQRAWRVSESSLLILCAVIGAWINSSRPHPRGRAWTMGLAAVGAMSALAIALIVYGIVHAVRNRMAPETLSA